MKDRVVQFPHRYQLVPVAGEEGTYDIVAKPGTITEAGTPINKATLLSDATAALYGLAEEDATVDEALRKAALLSPETAALYGLTGEDATVNEALALAAPARFIGKYSQMGGGSEMDAVSGIVSFSSILRDDFGAIDIITHPSRITIPAGISKVRFFASLIFKGKVNDAKAVGAIQLWKNGAAVSLISGVHTGVSFANSDVIDVAQGDYFELYFNARFSTTGTSTYSRLLSGSTFGMEVLK